MVIAIKIEGMDKTVVTIEITEEEKARLRTIAKRHDMTIGRGREKDWGSIRQLVAAVANGRLLVVANPQYESQDGR